MTSGSEEYGSPWYQNFWPWFIVVLLTVSVVASLLSVGLAYRNRDVDVRVRPAVQAPTDLSTSGLESRDPGR